MDGHPQPGAIPEILYIDGFAGPGEYTSGEAGSPIIALDTALAYRPPLEVQVHFLFVEKDSDRADHLRRLVALRSLPSNFHVIVDGSASFEAAFERRYPEFERNGRLIPTFAFVDPFGWKGTPFGLVKKILAQSSCEIFVNFMYEEINRFIGHPDQVSNFTSFFGTDAWTRCIDEADPARRNRCLHDLYARQLHEVARAKYVRSFEMSNARDVTDYYLFYATNSLKGLMKMKTAMWKVDQGGAFYFSDATDRNQLVLFQQEPNLRILEARLWNAYAGKDVSVGAIEAFVVVETAFRETHHKRILTSLEKAGRVTIVKAPPGRKAGTFADPGIVVRFNTETPITST